MIILQIHKRHSGLYQFVRFPARIFAWLKLGFRCKTAENLPDNYIVLSNHTTDFDPVLVALSFKKQMYFVASEHITRWKTAYKFLSYFFSPIIRNKGTTASSTVMEILRTVRAGQRVCVFAEGARTWDGITLPILPSTGKLVKGARCALVTYRIEGGYFANPRWGRKTRRGRMYGAPVNVYTAEQLAAMSTDEINEIIARDLYEDAYARQLENPVRYRSRRAAECLENLLFICSECGEKNTLHSHRNRLTCSKCGAVMRYTEYGMLEGGTFHTVLEYDRWQDRQVAVDAENGTEYSGENAVLTQLGTDSPTVIAQGRLTVGPNGMTIGDRSFAVDEISDIAMHGKRAIVFTAGDLYCELKPAREENYIRFYKLFCCYANSPRITAMRTK